MSSPSRLISEERDSASYPSPPSPLLPPSDSVIERGVGNIDETKKKKNYAISPSTAPPSPDSVATTDVRRKSHHENSQGMFQRQMQQNQISPPSNGYHSSNDHDFNAFLRSQIPGLWSWWQIPENQAMWMHLKQHWQLRGTQAASREPISRATPYNRPAVSPSGFRILRQPAGIHRQQQRLRPIDSKGKAKALDDSMFQDMSNGMSQYNLSVPFRQPMDLLHFPGQAADPYNEMPMGQVNHAYQPSADVNPNVQPGNPTSIPNVHGANYQYTHPEQQSQYFQSFSLESQEESLTMAADANIQGEHSALGDQALLSSYTETGTNNTNAIDYIRWSHEDITNIQSYDSTSGFGHPFSGEHVKTQNVPEGNNSNMFGLFNGQFNENDFNGIE